MDSNDITKFRPISNLSFLLKLIERVIVNQLQIHLSPNGLMSEYQWKYRKFQSSETVLLRVQNVNLVSLDSGHSTALLLLDLSVRIRYYWLQYSTSSFKTLVWYHIFCSFIVFIVSHQSFSNCSSFQLKIITCSIRNWYSTRQRFRAFTLLSVYHPTPFYRLKIP